MEYIITVTLPPKKSAYAKHMNIVYLIHLKVFLILLIKLQTAFYERLVILMVFDLARCLSSERAFEQRRKLVLRKNARQQGGHQLRQLPMMGNIS